MFSTCDITYLRNPELMEKMGKECGMKTLRAKGAVIFSLTLSIVPDIIIILLAINNFLENKMGMDGIIFSIVFAILFLLFGIYGGMRIYRTHWIQYGDGKVLIRRVSKELVNGRKVGKWENREDTFSLDDIEAYGLSWQALGHYVEHHRSSDASLTTECFFRLKNGKTIGYEVSYYIGKETDEFWRYIQDHTGLVFQKK